MNSKPKVGTVVQIVKSGNRYNAWDADGNKWTHAIISSTRKNNYNRGKPSTLERRTVLNTGMACLWRSSTLPPPFPPTPPI